jgi:hypothetical protein
MNATRAAAVAAMLSAAAVVPTGSAQAPAAPVVPVAARAADTPVPHVHDHSTHAHAPAARVKQAVRKPAAAKPAPKPKPLPAPKPTGTAPVWDGRAFGSPEAAMEFLVRAYNAHADTSALPHVTTPDARTNLVAMRPYAPALRLTSCAKLDTGAYDCSFRHTLADRGGWSGHATFRVAPAAKPGWYMTVLMDCGDGGS